MWQGFLETHHLILIVCILILALVLTGGARGLSKLFDAGLSRLSGKTTEVNLSVGKTTPFEPPKAECVACGLLVDPTKCPMHAAEHERSLRNEEEYIKLWENYGRLRDDMTHGFTKVQECILNSQQAILNALGSRSKGGN